MWSEHYDRPLEDVFAVQDEVVRTIVATLASRLEEAEVSAAVRKPTGNLAAYDALLRGVEHLRGYAVDDNRRARELFEQAVSLDSKFALAHAYLGLALIVEHGYGDAPEAIKRQALDATLAGLRLDSGDARCHLFVGLIYLYRGEHELALHHLERSNSLNPNDANCLSAVGSALGLLGRAEEGVELVQRAMRLNPFHPQWYWDDLAIVLYAAHRYEEAIEANLRITARKKPWHHARLAACYAQLGRLEEARAQVAEVLRMKPDFHLSNMDRVYKNSADAEHVLEGMRKAGLPE
jgi:tetratricopeptide (TPR) repeat protein